MQYAFEALIQQFAVGGWPMNSRVATWSAALSALLLMSPLARSQPADRASRSTLTFKMSAQVLDESSTQVANGIEVRAGDWPALIIATFEVRSIFGTYPGSCTASLVGPNVALMAAHCVDPKESDPDGGAISPVLEVGERKIPLRCEMHPDYRARPMTVLVPRGAEDFALCVLDDDSVRPAVLAAMRFEVVDAETPLARATPVLLTGYGCDHVRIVNGRPVGVKADGKLRLGDTVIDTPPGTRPDAAAYATVRSREGDEDPALCPGDSGGPLMTGVRARDPDRSRRIRGVNSSLAVSGDHLVSSVSVTGSPVFRTWADDWLRRHQQKYQPELCGVNLRAGERQCRN